MNLHVVGDGGGQVIGRVEEEPKRVQGPNEAFWGRRIFERRQDAQHIRVRCPALHTFHL